MFDFIVTERWRQNHPDASAGILVMHAVSNPEYHPQLEQRKQSLEHDLRHRYKGMERASLAGIPAIQAYNNYYKGFKKTYHVLLQLESIVIKRRSFPRVSTLVESMFMAELSHLLLTAGHDLNKIKGPVRVESAGGDEFYTTLQGVQKSLKAGDMCMLDDVGVISSVLYGPDVRTSITPHTTQILFTVYAPAGIEKTAVRKHLEDIRNNVILVTPTAQVEALEVY
jgi:DNA/RNA-binding domain of Phe-tRNA-synthetase-like protein